MRPHNLTLVMLGAGLLWFGWYGFNAGSALGANHTAAVVFVTTSCAGCRRRHRLAHPGAPPRRPRHHPGRGLRHGRRAGGDHPERWLGHAARRAGDGLAAGVICALAVGLKYRWGYDDSLDVVGVHLVGGLVGTLGIGLLATAAAPTGVDGLLYGGGVDQLGRQLLGAAVVLAYAFLVSGAIAWVVHRMMGFRIDEEHEVTGIDLVVHAETAYDLHSTAGSRTSGGFQAPKATAGRSPTDTRDAAPNLTETNRD